jgi:hypothetical protein
MWARFFSVIVLGVILLQCIIVISWQMDINRLHAKNWNNDSADERTQVTLSRVEFDKVSVNGQEIKINNKIYDIKSVKPTSTGYDLLVVIDEEEQSVLDKINHYFSDNDPLNEAGSLNISALFALNYFHHTGVFCFSSPFACLELSFRGTPLYNSIFQGHHTPPPKSLLLG